MRNNRSALIALVVVAALVGGFYAIQKHRPARKPVLTQSSIQKETGVPVVVASPKRRNVDDVLSVTGQLAADSTVTLSTKVAGKVVSVAAREGGAVSAGQVVIQLDDADARRQLAQAQAGLDQARAGLQVAEARLSQARTGKSVGDIQTSSGVDAAKAAVRSAKARLEMVTTGARRQERIQAQNAVDSAKAGLDKAQADYQRYKALADQGAVSASTLDGFRTALNVSKAQYDSALQSLSLVKEGPRTEDVRQAEAGLQQAEESLRTAVAARKTTSTRTEDVNAAIAGVSTARASLGAARAAVGIAEQNVENFKIRSPRSGSVTMRSVEPGQYANPGQALLTVVDLGTVYLQADVSEVDMVQVRPGMVVNVRVDALPGRTWRGRVDSIVATADPSSRSFTAKVIVPNPDKALRPNMFARADVITGLLANALLVPKESVFERDGKSIVVRVKDGKADIVNVTPGVVHGDEIVLRGAGLGVNDKVVTSGQQDLSDGQKVALPAKG
ncbi:MAG TPA: efflux RND transporter periplasmic adaptor subunit [Armatimonadota bacterium]